MLHSPACMAGAPPPQLGAPSKVRALPKRLDNTKRSAPPPSAGAATRRKRSGDGPAWHGVGRGAICGHRSQHFAASDCGTVHKFTRQPSQALFFFLSPVHPIQGAVFKLLLCSSYSCDHTTNAQPFVTESLSQGKRRFLCLRLPLSATGGLRARFRNAKALGLSSDSPLAWPRWESPALACLHREPRLASPCLGSLGACLSRAEQPWRSRSLPLACGLQL